MSLSFLTYEIEIKIAASHDRYGNNMREWIRNPRKLVLMMMIMTVVVRMAVMMMMIAMMMGWGFRASYSKMCF